MALLPLIPATDISLDTLRLAYNNSSTQSNISMGDYFRNGAFVPSYTNNNGIAAVSGTTVVGNNLSIGSFSGARVSGWVYRDTLQTITGEGQFTATEAVILFEDVYNNTTGTQYFMRSNSTSPVIYDIGGGSIVYNISTGTTALSTVMANNGMGDIVSAAWNANINLTVVADSLSGTASNIGIPRTLLNWTYSAGLKSIVNSSPTFWKNSRLIPWGNYIFAIKDQCTSNGTTYLATIAYTSDGVNWTSYTLDVGIAAIGNASVVNGQLAIYGGAVTLANPSLARGALLISSDPTNPASWTTRSSVAAIFTGPSNRYINTVAYSNGVWLCGGSFGIIARSTTGLDDFTEVRGSNSLYLGEGSYWWAQANNAVISKIRPYKTGFMAWSSQTRSVAWSPDGANWYNAVGNRKNGPNLAFTNAHYDPVLDRSYIWSPGGLYTRSDGGDMQFTVDGVNFL